MLSFIDCFMASLIQSILIGSVDLLMTVRIVHGHWPSDWNVLILNVVWLNYWVRVLIDHSSTAHVVTHFGHLNLLRICLVVNDRLNPGLSLNRVLHFC